MSSITEGIGQVGGTERKLGIGRSECLRSHPQRRSAYARVIVGVGVPLFGHSKVRDSQLPPCSQQQVAALDVTMYDGFPVQIHKGVHQTVAHVGHLLLGQTPLVSNDLIQRATAAVVHHNPHLVLRADVHHKQVHSSASIRTATVVHEKNQGKRIERLDYE